VVFIYFYKQIFSLKQFHKAIANIWFLPSLGVTAPNAPPCEAAYLSPKALSQREFPMAFVPLGMLYLARRM